MEVNYTDYNHLPQGTLSKYSVDLDIGKDNNFEIQMNIKNHCMTHKSIWYVDGTEIGGIVDAVTVDTNKGIVSYTGRSWRGILQKKILEPDTGEDYFVVSGEANAVLWQIIQRLGLIDFFAVPDVDSGILVNNFQFDRYVDAYTGIMKMLASVNAKPVFVLSDLMIVLQAVKIEDLSEKYEYSDDYGMKIIMEDSKGGVNHLICLGSGDLAERDVIHLYVGADGEITDKQYYFGVNEITETYDYGASETLEELRNGGVKRLDEQKSRNTISAQFQKLDVDIGDIVGGKNRMTGIKLKERVTSEIVKIKNDVVTITYEVGE